MKSIFKKLIVVLLTFGAVLFITILIKKYIPFIYKFWLIICFAIGFFGKDILDNI
jgi:uncharacterized membrane protein YccC